MPSLKDKLAYLNKMYLKKSFEKKRALSLEGGGPETVSNSGEAAITDTPTKKTPSWAKGIKKGIDPGLIYLDEKIQDIKPDTELFDRFVSPSAILEESVPCIDTARLQTQGFLRIFRDMDKFWLGHKVFMELFSSKYSNEKFKNQFKFDSQPGDWCFLDLETCGLAGSPLFLIGICYIRDGALELEQFFARDLGEEAVAVDAFFDRFQEFKGLITFNGKSFDWPFLQERAQLNGLFPPPPGFHLDLLHEGRRRWRHSLTNCKLQTMEKALCHRSRVGDIPGRSIPQAYADFMEYPGKPEAMADVIHHNALDLITLAELLFIMVAGEEVIGKY